MGNNVMSDGLSTPTPESVIPTQSPKQTGHNPCFSWVHLFESGSQTFILIVDGSRIYEIPNSLSGEFSRSIDERNEAELARLLHTHRLESSPWISIDAPESFPTHAISLAVAQRCNLGCTYCYAQEGGFGGPNRNMSVDVTLNSVRSLFRHVKAGERVNLAFMGGEPMINRTAVIQATELAECLGREKNIAVGFSITTNGTLLREEDVGFFETHGFAVTVSLDGVGNTHDLLRSFKTGRGSYDRILERIRPFLERQRSMQVSARVTLTPRNLELKKTLDAFIDMGFHSVGFSPMLSSPTCQDEMHKRDLETMREQMIECGKSFEQNVIAGRRYPFSNMVNAMKELHKGTHRPYPCGAGAGYVGVGTEGDLFACHRFVDDGTGYMGHIDSGVDPNLQKSWLANRHVERQEPCKSCWAKYLCGGGCHHEVIHRGRPACDYIRGWLDYCLQAYVRLLDKRPDYFSP